MISYIDRMYPFQIVMKASDMEALLVFVWCNNNEIDVKAIDIKNGRRTFCFHNEEDAIAFKLRWFE